ncbi:MAG: CRISPR-associated endonuclease Cas2 [Chloroflexi bacterium]|nr:CRISPR-associated endonuclease Cas2 [Chloroflexota bacterium]
MFVVVSYDIPDDKRRTRVMKILKDYGAHVQYSVFECDLRPQDLKRMRERLDRLIDKQQDNVRFYRLCEDCLRRTQIVGRERVEPLKDFYVL